jgi:hypothetical protein
MCEHLPWLAIQWALNCVGHTVVLQDDDDDDDYVISWLA